MTPSRRSQRAVGRASALFSPTAEHPLIRPPDGGRRPDGSRRPRPARPEPPQPVVPSRKPLPARDRPSAWHLLLAIPVLAPLFTPFYNRLEPRLFGMPFFYWGQLACVLFAMAVTTFVYQATKRRP